MKNYNSIGHLPGSQLGRGDRVVDAGMVKYATEKARSERSRITASEKIDGSNCGILRTGHSLQALTRGGGLACRSRFIQHQCFARWVEMNRSRFMHLLRDGERLVVEWTMQAHGIRYGLPDREPVFALDLICGTEIVAAESFAERVDAVGIKRPKVLIQRIGATVSVQEALAALGTHGHHGALDYAEGVVWRVEENDKFKFMCKFVQPDFSPGQYIPNFNPDVEKPLWNISPKELFVG